MANYPNIVRLRPEVRDFIRNRRWVHRGEVIAYGPNIRCDSFSTDAAGFRHSVFKGATLSVADVVKQERYGLVLGSSNLYGFGLAGNENTMPSLLAERFGFPFAGIALPEANSRDLYSLLLSIVARTPHPPSVVLHFNAGDFTGFCYTGIADPVFGYPNLKQLEMALKERGGRPDPTTQYPSLLAFTSLWTRAIGQFCRARNVPLVLGNDTTFFEKREPNQIETESKLGEAANPAQQVQFDTHRRFSDAYYDRREQLAEALGVPLAGPGRNPGKEIGFIDEFHYDREGTRILTDAFASAIEPLLTTAPKPQRR